MPIDTREIYGYDSLRRVAGTMYAYPELFATGTQALVFSLHFDGKGANFVPTQSTRVKYSRLDNTGATYTSYVFLRRTTEDITGFNRVIDMKTSPFNKEPVEVFSRVANMDPTTIMDANRRGINGWALASVSYKISRQAVGEIFQDIKIPVGGFLGAGSTHEVALVLDTTETTQVVANVHYDFVESN